VSLALILTLALIRPNPSLTPGDILTTDKQVVCRPGYSATVRHVTRDQINAVAAAYGVVLGRALYEIDHLISLELGGSNDTRNLWPEPYFGPFNAHIKDTLENRLHKLVCDDRITIQEAQQAIAVDWIGALKKYGGQNGR